MVSMDGRTYISFTGVLVNLTWSFPMSNTSVKVAFAVFMVLALPAASFARGGGSAGMGHSGGVGGARPNAATLGALENMQVNPSGMRNAGVTPIPPPRITVPTVPQFK
jgi:hypothetical protein